MSNTREFKIEVLEEDIEDLKRRIVSTRWPEKETVEDWTQGVPDAYMRELSEYWLNEYDWRAREAYHNRLPQFLSTFQGLDIHFIHCISPHRQAKPLLITHGWPGSVVEFHK